MRIGKMVEAAAGISEYTLRYYERKGLIRVRRDDAGRRCYTIKGTWKENQDE